NDTSTLFIYSKFTFWIVLGIIMYLAGSFFIYIFAAQRPETRDYWYLTNVFSIFKSILFTIAFIIHGITQKKNPPQKLQPYLN
ncbi:MAG TPA: hypothetical protein VHK69_08615, partial [Chitinophagaceae bacterium]|nr:hypothetical protein [Chitinophagaceae bacterium]